MLTREPATRTGGSIVDYVTGASTQAGQTNIRTDRICRSTTHSDPLVVLVFGIEFTVDGILMAFAPSRFLDVYGLPQRLERILGRQVAAWVVRVCGAFLAIVVGRFTLHVVLELLP